MAAPTQTVTVTEKTTVITNNVAPTAEKGDNKKTNPEVRLVKEVPVSPRDKAAGNDKATVVTVVEKKPASAVAPPAAGPIGKSTRASPVYTSAVPAGTRQPAYAAKRRVLPPRREPVSSGRKVGQYELGFIVSCFCFVASCLTTLLGAIYIIQLLDQASLRFGGCDFFEEDCNASWRRVFSLDPNVVLNTWSPLLLGLIGVAIHIRRILEPLQAFLPQDYIQYFIFMLVTALFGNLAYCGMLGVLIGIYSILCSLFCIVARVAGETGGIRTFARFTE